MSIGIRIGEVCYNLRSALDYLIFELAKLDSCAEQSGTQFPIIDAKEDFEGRGKRIFLKEGINLLKGINLAHVAAIEQLQPCNGCQWFPSHSMWSAMWAAMHSVNAFGLNSSALPGIAGASASRRAAIKSAFICLVSFPCLQG
jgi:hypothetical protein